MNTPTPSSGITRRSFTTAAAWTAPAVAIAMAAPAASASGALAASAYGVEGYAIGDQAPLSIEITRDGAPLNDGTTVSVSLGGTDVIEVDTENDGYVNGRTASVTIVGGVATVFVIVRSFGVVGGVVAYGSSQVTFSVSVTES
ncbi:hypothetical protein ACF044_12970 [Microbacterium sp. NPDC016588]